MLVQTLAQHFEPPGLVQSNRLKFNQRLQQTAESVFEYVSVLQTMAVHCAWGEFYENALTGQLIVGIKHQDTRQKLVSTANLTWALAKEMAIADDTMCTQMRALAQSHAQTQGRVLAVKADTKKAPEKTQPQGAGQAQSKPKPKNSGQQEKKEEDSKKYGPCHRCGRKHNVHTCPAKDWECRSCKKIGHIASKCPVKKENVNVIREDNPTGGKDDDQEKLVDCLLDWNFQ